LHEIHFESDYDHCRFKHLPAAEVDTGAQDRAQTYGISISNPKDDANHHALDQQSAGLFDVPGDEDCQAAECGSQQQAWKFFRNIAQAKILAECV
jgi:hypothetical protein